MKPIRPGHPIVAFLLNCACLIAGLGYLYLGQLRKAAVTFAIFAFVLGLEWLISRWSLERAVVALNPLLWLFMLLTAMDAAILAGRARRGETVARDEVASPLLRWMGRYDSTSTKAG